MALAVLSGCANAGGGSEVQVDPSTSQVIVETQADPWALPLEERPELFDPCAEVPKSAIAESLGGEFESVEYLHNDKPGELQSCGWENDDLLLGVLATWKSRTEYLSDTAYSIDDVAITVAGRPAMRGNRTADTFSSSCRYFFFTSRGTAVVSLDLTSSLNVFRGERLANGCEALSQVADPLVNHLPEGDF